MKITEADLRALRDVACRQDRGTTAHQRAQTAAVESIYPIAAANAAGKGLLTRYEQSENCKPNRRRYFSEYRLTAAGSKVLADAMDGACV
jgi:hypothetical protein